MSIGTALRSGRQRRTGVAAASTYSLSAATCLRTDAKRKQIGFIQARQLKPKDRYVLPDDEDW